MSNKASSNNLDARIKTAIQYVMNNLISSNLSANTINFSVFKLEEIRYYNFKLNIQYDKKNIITVKKNSYT